MVGEPMGGIYQTSTKIDGAFFEKELIEPSTILTMEMMRLYNEIRQMMMNMGDSFVGKVVFLEMRVRTADVTEKS
jgi:hypothetical protein